MRSRPVPWAYRVLYRHLGIDPDVTRTPVEELVVERLLTRRLLAARACRRTRSRSPRSRPACPVYAVDADTLAGALVLAPDAGGRLVLADGAGHRRGAVRDAGAGAPARAASTRALALVAVQAPGVDDIFVEEAVWTAAAAMRTIDAPS